jgi:TIR domain
LAEGHIFVSYSSADRAFAEDLVRQLEAAGNRIWYAPRNVRPGTDYSEQIQAAIEQAGAFVIIVSNAANESDFVRAETEMAFSRRRPIFPVRCGPVAPAPGLALFLQLRHWTDAFGPSRHNAVARLGHELAGLAPRGGKRGGRSPFVRPPDPGAQPSRSRAVIPLAVIGCGALLLCIMLIVQAPNQAVPNAVAAAAGSNGAAGNAAAAAPAGGEPNMAPLEAWRRINQDIEPLLPVEEVAVDNMVPPANVTAPATDTTAILTGNSAVNGM